MYSIELNSLKFTFYTKKDFSEPKGLFDSSVVSLTKNEYGSAVYFLYILPKPLVLISDEWFIAICWSSLLFGIFAMKKWVVFRLTLGNKNKRNI